MMAAAKESPAGEFSTEEVLLSSIQLCFLKEDQVMPGQKPEDRTKLSTADVVIEGHRGVDIP